MIGTMEMTTHVGAVQFALKGAGYAAWPDLCLTGISLVEGQPLAAASQGDTRFLVLDHRTDAGPGPAWVEYWRPGCGAEGGLEGLFVVSDAHAAPGSPAPLPLDELARSLAAPGSAP